MNEILKTFLVTGDKFMFELHLRQPGLTYNDFKSFTEQYERIQKFKETGDSNYIYKNKLDHFCFARNAAYANFKDLVKRTVSDKI